MKQTYSVDLHIICHVVVLNTADVTFSFAFEPPPTLDLCWNISGPHLCMYGLHGELTLMLTYFYTDGYKK